MRIYPYPKKEIKKVLLSYTTGFVSFFGRTHQKIAEDLIADCDSNEVDVADLMQNLRQYMADQNYNPNSSFLKRFEYLDARFRVIESDRFNKRDIKRIFANYVHTGHFRNHLDEARRIMEACKDENIELNDLVASMTTYVNTHEFNEDSHFLLCFNQVKDLQEEQQNIGSLVY